MLPKLRGRKMTMKGFLCFIPGLFRVFGGVASAWEFPRLALSPQNLQHPFTADDGEDVDIVTGSQFHGLKTFANLPYMNCLSDAEAEGKKYDIAILGAPFDTVSALLPVRDLI